QRDVVILRIDPARPRQATAQHREGLTYVTWDFEGCEQAGHQVLRLRRQVLVFRFRSSHQFAAHSHANFGIKGTLAISILSSTAYEFEVPQRASRQVIGTSNSPHQAGRRRLTMAARATATITTRVAF